MKVLRILIEDTDGVVWNVANPHELVQLWAVSMPKEWGGAVLSVTLDRNLADRIVRTMYDDETMKAQKLEWERITNRVLETPPLRRIVGVTAMDLLDYLKLEETNLVTIPKEALAK